MNKSIIWSIYHDSKEFNIIKRHTYYTYRILEPLKALKTINAWGAFHHERLDGRGYPFHHDSDNLSLGSQIMAVADVFTALAEDRPYRKGMEQDKVVSILKKMADGSAINAEVVTLLKDNYEEINSLRHQSQVEANQKYHELRQCVL